MSGKLISFGRLKFRLCVCGKLIVSHFFSGTMLSNTEGQDLPSIKLGDFTLEFELGPPPPEVQEVARKELRESPELQKEACARFQELLRSKLIKKIKSFWSLCILK